MPPLYWRYSIFHILNGDIPSFWNTRYQNESGIGPKHQTRSSHIMSDLTLTTTHPNHSEGIATLESLIGWIQLCCNFIHSLHHGSNSRHTRTVDWFVTCPFLVFVTQPTIPSLISLLLLAPSPFSFYGSLWSSLITEAFLTSSFCPSSSCVLVNAKGIKCWSIILMQCLIADMYQQF